MADRHDAQGWWQAEAGAVEPLPPVSGATAADVVIVGGGYTGLWTAWFCKQLEPGADVALLEAGVCGSGASGRNAGFVNEMWFGLPGLRLRFGDREALAVARASTAAVAGVGRWCAEHGVDAWFRQGGYLLTSTTPRHDVTPARLAAACAEVGAPDACRLLDTDEVAGRCASPRFRGGVFFPGAATVHPARLAHGLRERVAQAGVRLFERSPARRVAESPDGVEVEAPGGRVRAGSAVLAAGPWLARLRPLRRRMTLTSSHMVITEPVPDVLDALGWTGGECITDARMMVHYFRTTPDGRIAFGWGGGPVVPGSRLGDRVDLAPRVVTEVEDHLRRFFPALEGRRITHGWGGPIDVSPSHVPIVAALPGGRAWSAFGYTGNGVGPTHLSGRILAGLALDRRDEYTSLALVEPPPSARVPPEPLRYVGGRAIRAAVVRKEAAEEAGRAADPLARMVAAIPERIGIHVGR
jgi:glycine/D-amino acid oxidase-like deaminating enzyme